MAILNSVLLVCGGANAGKSRMIRCLIIELCGQLGRPSPTGNRIPRIRLYNRNIETRLMSLGDLKKSVEHLIRDLATVLTSTGDRKESADEFRADLKREVAKPGCDLVDYLCAARPSQCKFPNGAVSPDVVETCRAIVADYPEATIKIITLEPPYTTMPRRFPNHEDYHLTDDQRVALKEMGIDVLTVGPKYTTVDVQDYLRFFDLQ